jgi:hypothetical protein
MHKVGRFDCGRIHLVPRVASPYRLMFHQRFVSHFNAFEEKDSEVIVTMDVVMSGTDGGMRIPKRRL